MDSTKKPSKATQPPDGLNFGMVDLGDDGGEGDDGTPLTIDKLPAQKAAPEQKQPPARIPPAGKTTAPAIASPSAPRPAPERSSQPRPPSRYEPVTVSAPPLVSPRTLKLALLVALILALLAGGVFGFLKWRDQVKQQEIQEKESLDSRSLDSLRDQALRTDGLK